MVMDSCSDPPMQFLSGVDRLLRIIERCTLCAVTRRSDNRNKSKRRKAQILALRGDVNVVDYGGNVMTRINPDTMHAHGVDGVVIAYSGIKRLADYVPPQTQMNVEQLNPVDFLPCVNQGILLGQCRDDDQRSVNLFKLMQEQDTTDYWKAERAVIETLGADCRAAVAVFAKIDADALELEARAYTDDGKHCIVEKITGDRARAEHLGNEVGQQMLVRIKASGVDYKMGRP
jgi:hydroxymethylbilane synthase